MKNTSDWNTFMKTGSVEDYLRYTGAYREDTKAAKESTEINRRTVEGFNAKSDNGVRNDYQIRTD